MDQTPKKTESQELSGIKGPCVSYTATIHQELPQEVVDVLKKHDLKIKLDKVNVNNMFDQMSGMVATDGCISSPSGPRC